MRIFEIILLIISTVLPLYISARSYSLNRKGALVFMSFILILHLVFEGYHIDTSKIGVFGHSQGGAAAGQALIDDDRIKAGINIDGVQWGPMIDTVLTKPFALISSDWKSPHPDFNEHIFHNGSTSDFYKVEILNSGHSNFMDIPLMVNLPFVNEAGTIEPNRAYEVSTKVILQFFDKYLLEKPSDLLRLSSEHASVEVIKESQ